jgi:hypothetical protein
MGAVEYTFENFTVTNTGFEVEDPTFAVPVSKLGSTSEADQLK